LPSFDIHEILMRMPPIFFALTVHEFAHAWVALRCGDPTAQDMGRVTFNPLAHLDPIGTLCLFFGPIGWAKPVPVNPANFRHPRRDDVLVSLAGVTANLVTAITVAIVIRVTLASGANPAEFSRPMAILWEMAFTLLLISVGLMVFNLIPIPPLDGSHVLMRFLPWQMAQSYRRAAPMLSMIFLILLISGAFGNALMYPILYIVGLLLGLPLLD